MRGHRVFVVALAIGLASCINLTAHQRAFTVGAITKETVEQAASAWNLYVEAQKTKCDPSSNATVTTKSAYRECLGPAIENPKIIVALEAVDLALEALGVALKSTDPTAIAPARDRVVQAARDAIALMGPDAARFASDLRTLIAAQ